MPRTLQTIKRLSERQNNRCCYCGVDMLIPGFDQPRKRVGPIGKYRRLYDGNGARDVSMTMRIATIEHVYPASQRGDCADDHLVAACLFDNNLRGDTRLSAFVAFIDRLVSNGKHPHQVYLKTGVWPQVRKISRQLRTFSFKPTGGHSRIHAPQIGITKKVMAG